MPVINMGICNHMHQFPNFHATYLRQHMEQHRILHHIPVISRQHILRTLI